MLKAALLPTTCLLLVAGAPRLARAADTSGLQLAAFALPTPAAVTSPRAWPVSPISPISIAKRPARRPNWEVREIRSGRGDREMPPAAVAALNKHIEPLPLPIGTKGNLRAELRVVRGRIVEVNFTRSHSSLEDVAVLAPLRERLLSWQTDITFSGYCKLYLRATTADPEKATEQRISLPPTAAPPQQ